MPAQLLRALADPTRRAVFERIARAEMTVSQVRKAFAISQPAISQHLAALKRAGLVRQRRQGRFTYYRAEPGGLQPLMTWIARYRAFWPERIAELQLMLRELEE